MDELTEDEKQIKAAWDARDCIKLCELAEEFRRERDAARAELAELQKEQELETIDRLGGMDG